MTIFIGCASSNDIPEKYKSDCQKYLEEILKENDLVFGADNSGLMGISHDIALKNKRKIVGICPQKYQDDFKKLKCTHELKTNKVHERTSLLEKNSDACIFLPGGVGTIYEFFSLLESKRSKEFDKPIVLYNSHNFFKELFTLLDKIYDEKFTKEEIKNYYHISNSAEDTLKYINNYSKNI